jgi:hypothetical protein
MKLYYFDEKGKSYRFRIYPYLLLLVVMSMLLSINKSNPQAVEYEKEPFFVETYTGEEPFSFNAFKQYVLDSGIEFPDIVIAQAIQESTFKSEIFKENNNPFGMKEAKSRNTTAIGTNRNHAKYKDWRFAVQDYALFQSAYTRKIKTREQYFNYLKHYAEDENYERKLKKILKEYKGFGISKEYRYDL